MRDAAIAQKDKQSAQGLIGGAITAVIALFAPSGEFLPRYKVDRLHAKIDRWNTRYNYWQSQELAQRAQYFRRRRRIMDYQAFELVMFAAYVEAYSDILTAAAPLYEEIAEEKYLLLTGQAVSDTMVTDNWVDVMLPIGATALMLLYVEAAHRARRMARTVAGNELTNADDQLVRNELTRAKNALLKPSSKGGWHGKLDSAMTYCVGLAAYRACLDNPESIFEFHAIIDDVTTDVCTELNGKQFRCSEAVLGLNVPPITTVPHFCRSWIEIIGVSGAASGALDSESERAKRHAEQYYEAVRKMTTDYKKIAANTGFAESDILAIKNYLFVDKHKFLDGNRFDPHNDIAQSWQRLIDGKNIKRQDLILLNHELMEMRLVKGGMSQREAHTEASRQFNFVEAAKRGR